MQTPNFPSRDEVLLLHADQITTFGGTAGVRDQGLLDSALAQPRATFGGELLHPTLAIRPLRTFTICREIILLLTAINERPSQSWIHF